MIKLKIFLIVFFVCLLSLPGTGFSQLNLISADELKTFNTEHIILDARSPKNYTNGHIPGSYSFYWEDYTGVSDKNVPYRMKSPQFISAQLSTMGIDKTSHLVIYGSGIKNFGGEGWAIWALTWLGHKGDIYLLKGGVKSWIKNKFDLQKIHPITQKEESNKQSYAYNINNDVLTTLADVQSNLKNQDAYLIDTRTYLERLKGSIPGSVHISWKNYFKKDHATPIGLAAIETLLRKHNIGKDKPVIYFCTGGIRSAWVWLVHHLSGYSPASNYEGSMAQWQAETL